MRQTTRPNTPTSEFSYLLPTKMRSSMRTMALSRLVVRRGILGHRNVLPANFGRSRTAPRDLSRWLMEQMFDWCHEAPVWCDAIVRQAASDQGGAQAEGEPNEEGAGGCYK